MSQNEDFEEGQPPEQDDRGPQGDSEEGEDFGEEDLGENGPEGNQGPGMEESEEEVDERDLELGELEDGTGRPGFGQSPQFSTNPNFGGPTPSFGGGYSPTFGQSGSPFGAQPTFGQSPQFSSPNFSNGPSFSGGPSFATPSFDTPSFGGASSPFGQGPDSGQGANKGAGNLLWAPSTSREGLYKVENVQRKFDKTALQITKDKIEAVKRTKMALKRAQENLREVEKTEDLRKIITAQIQVDRARRDYYEARNNASPLGVPVKRKDGWWDSFGADEKNYRIDEEAGGVEAYDLGVSENVGDFVEARTLADRVYSESFPRARKLQVLEKIGFVVQNPVGALRRALNRF